MFFWQMAGTSGEWWCTQPCQGSISAFMVVELCCRLLPEFLRLHSEAFAHSISGYLLILLPKNFPRMPNFPWLEKNAPLKRSKLNQPQLLPEFLRLHSEAFAHPSRATCLFYYPRTFHACQIFPSREKNAPHPSEEFQTHSTSGRTPAPQNVIMCHPLSFQCRLTGRRRAYNDWCFKVPERRYASGRWRVFQVNGGALSHVKVPFLDYPVSISAFMVVELCCRLLPEFLRLHSEAFAHSISGYLLILLPKNFPLMSNFPWREKNAPPEAFQTHPTPGGPPAPQNVIMGHPFHSSVGYGRRQAHEDWCFKCREGLVLICIFLSFSTFRPFNSPP
ncbi:hypothetical protein CEXT_271511 [Caerostris extrusa]|uniref:Uncharacterized protein n=1 Tax=Caerostris extrusa TaxID=172846 RepID=A0AAV4PQ82_CAEEX|nr:hypothetical protein CEXT_271511 [Caerostris extrusa]